MISPLRDNAACAAHPRAMPAARRLALLALGALLAVGSPGTAAAQDWLDDFSLRGSVPGGPVRWDGIVMGAQIGYSNMNSDFESTTAPPNTGVVPDTTTSSASYGGFLGHNFQWDDLVLGIDGGYTRPSSLVTTSQGTSGGISASSSMRLIDYATLRARAGYAFGQFLPYAFVGGAIGRMNYSTVQAGVLIANRDNAFNGGLTAGLGLDVAILPNVFLRGEWEYIAFAQVSGARVTTNTARVGVGVRF